MSAWDDNGMLNRLEAGMPLLYGGNKVTYVDEALADAYTAGDRVLVTDAGDILHIPTDDATSAEVAVAAATQAFAQMSRMTDDSITRFFNVFADLLQEDSSFAPIAEANAADVASAKERGRSTTRLVLSDGMRSDMIAGLRTWAETTSSRGEVVNTVQHEGWSVQQRRDALGVVAFIFEGRPNVFADACGVLRTGNTVVFRIGSDALGTARAIVEHALRPALALAGLPEGAVSLVDSPSRASGWALFADSRLGLAVARGSGKAVEQLGSVARSSGVPVSLHGTGGAWMIAGAAADADRFAAAVENSLDRKVCNTLNTCIVLRDNAETLVPRLLSALEGAAAKRNTSAKLHVLTGSQDVIPEEWFTRHVTIEKADGEVTEPQADVLASVAELGREWEWENSPEISVAVADDLAQAMRWCSTYSPRLVASLISESAIEHEDFYRSVDVPFVSNGFTRWVDGQFAFDKPELGLSNWENGRLLGRGGVLSGDSVHTVRTIASQEDPALRR